jgi:hypothetical protein
MTSRMKIEEYIERGRCPVCGGVTDDKLYQRHYNRKPPRYCSCYEHDPNDPITNFINQLISDDTR